MMDNTLFSSVVQLRHTLHMRPTLSGDERSTIEQLMAFLKANTKLEICDMGEYFYAVYRCEKPQKRIAFRADMDALPIDEGTLLPYSSTVCGVSHKCGHDGHCACLAAFAVEVDRIGCKSDVFFLFQHAEETGAGARICSELIEREHIDEIYGFHNMPGFPLGAVMVHNGTAACASTGLILSFFGRRSHASQPENGRNPAFAISRLILDIPELTRADRYTGMVMCTVICVDVGKEAFGTSAGEGRLMLTVRAEHESELDRLISELISRAKLYCNDASLRLDTEFRDAFPETYNHPECAERVRRCCDSLGIPIARWDEPFRSSEDFGYYTKLTKGALFYVGDGETHPPLHTAEFDFPDDIIKTVCGIYMELIK